MTAFRNRPFGIRAGIAGIITLYILTMLGMLGYTVFTFQSQRSDAVLIDLAGRQRMLNTRHMMQIFLVSQGLEADFHFTRRVLDQTLQALTYGGEAIINLGNQKVEVLPSAATQAIREKLDEQKALIQEFTAKADAFLKIHPTHPRYQAALDELRNLDVALHRVTDDSVKMLSNESRTKVTEMLEGQIVVALLVGVLGVLLTLQVTRANKERLQEILGRQKAQEDLRKSEAQTLEALRQSDTLKSALLSSVSHELRTPLTSIKAMTSRALDHSGRSQEPFRVEYLEAINQEINHLTRLVDNLLDMSRIESGTLQPNRDWELLEDLIEAAIGSLEKSLRKRTLQLDLEEDLPTMFIDGVQIQQVLVNLLENAVKYSNEGTGITLNARLKGNTVEVQVSNAGEGIPEDELPKIFDRFYRVPSSRERNIRGTGLGLAICKSIIEAHGGRIWVQSIPKHITTFTLILPLSSETREPLPSGQIGKRTS